MLCMCQTEFQTRFSLRVPCSLLARPTLVLRKQLTGLDAVDTKYFSSCDTADIERGSDATRCARASNASEGPGAREAVLGGSGGASD